MNFNDKTMFEYIKKYCEKSVIPLHMPGHKRNVSVLPNLQKLGASYDMTEIFGMDDLHNPEGIIKAAQQRCARLWHSKHSYMLINGSTCGILAAINAYASGKSVVIARNCHKSVYHAAELCKTKTSYIYPQILNSGIFASVTPESVEKAILLSKPAMVIITSPTYEGVISDIKSISEICRKYNVLLMVDEAHGAHLDLSEHFTGGAVLNGADIVIQSLHKTLAGLTQTAAAHLNGKIDNFEAFEHSLDIFETSSPSYLLMSSIDECVSFLLKDKSKFDLWYSNLSYFYKETRELKSLKLIERKKPEVFKEDITKIVVSTAKTNITGTELAKILRNKYNIETEMAAANHIIAYTGIFESSENLMALAKALCSIDSLLPVSNNFSGESSCTYPHKELEIYEAINFDQEVISLGEASGRISGEYLWAYPPGIPYITPGEKIDSALISEIKKLKNAHINLIGKGLDNNLISVIK